MKQIYFFFILCISIVGYTQSPDGDIAIIPQPVSLVKQQGSFLLPEQLTIHTGKNAEVKKIGSRLAERISATTGYKVVVNENTDPASNGISLVLAANKSFPKEGYQLEVKTTHIILEAAEPAGIFYAVQTLLQLLPKEIESKSKIEKDKWEIPAVTITDHPRFGWRGLMLDVSRHFFTKEQVKEFIDDMVKYKFNVLHWHLTDDQGWRIEIKSLPKLTSVGAWRVDKTGTFNTFSKPEPNEPRTSGGFYTQEDIKEIVQYAQERFVDILPEIDVPGHSMAAVAAYPELSCTPSTYAVNSGEPFMDWSHGHPPIALVDNTLCPAKENVYQFLDKVFTEVAQLFPFEYIHMGGDETARNYWEKSAA